MRPERTLIIVVALAAALIGCKVTTDDVEAWKGTVKGPGKIVAVLLSDNYGMDLRTAAALSLIEMERSDVNGVAELQQALKRLDDATRQEIVQGMVSDLTRMMQGGDAADGGGPSPAQVQAKDAAYVLIPEAGPKARKELTEAVVSWYSVDFNGRSLAGNYSAEQVVRALGAPAAKQLVEALNPRMPQPAIVKIAELIGQVGNEKTKAKAADRLVAIEHEMEQDAFLDWLKGKIGEELKKQSPDDKPDPKRVDAIAVLNREKFITEGALPAMKHLADQKKVSDRLLEVATVRSDNQFVVERRVKALQALEGNADESQLDALLTLALDQESPVQVRDYAFDRVGDIRSKKALPRLWPLVQSGTDQRLRWRAGELVLAIGGADVAEQFFQKLPSGGDAEYAPEELEGYATRLSQLNPPPTDLVRGKLRSGSWWERVIALRFLERRGGREDLAAMQKMVNDKAAPKGPSWPDGATVGAVAKEAVLGLEQLLEQPSEAEDKG
jgi:HEAT repeat protein